MRLSIGAASYPCDQPGSCHSQSVLNHCKAPLGEKPLVVSIAQWCIWSFFKALKVLHIVAMIHSHAGLKPYVCLQLPRRNLTEACWTVCAKPPLNILSHCDEAMQLECLAQGHNDRHLDWAKLKSPTYLLFRNVDLGPFKPAKTITATTTKVSQLCSTNNLKNGPQTDSSFEIYIYTTANHHKCIQAAGRKHHIINQTMRLLIGDADGSSDSFTAHTTHNASPLIGT